MTEAEFEAQERIEFEAVAKKLRLSLTRLHNKPDEYAFCAQKAWMAWMISAKRQRAKMLNQIIPPEDELIKLGLEASLDCVTGLQVRRVVRAVVEAIKIKMAGGL